MISPNNIARDMVRGSQVRFQFTKNTFSLLFRKNYNMPPLSKKRSVLDMIFPSSSRPSISDEQRRIPHLVGESMGTS
jgi:hypothetical protein